MLEQKVVIQSIPTNLVSSLTTAMLILSKSALKIDQNKVSRYFWRPVYISVLNTIFLYLCLIWKGPRAKINHHCVITKKGPKSQKLKNMFREILAQIQTISMILE